MQFVGRTTFPVALNLCNSVGTYDYNVLVVK
jgi:hypothetical protein